MSKTIVRTPIVEFARKSSPATVDGDHVRRRGIIFRAGDYSNQNFSMSPDELRKVASTFKGSIPVDHGHQSVEGPIDFGRLESVEVSPDGTTLYGNTVHPAWVNTALADAKWLVSASFDRATKAIRRLSLVTRPQISDAELQAAFACACGGHVEEEEIATMPNDSPQDRRARAMALVNEMDEDDLAIMLGEGDIPDDDVIANDGAEFASDSDPDDDTTSAEFAYQRARIAELEAKDRRRDAEVFIDSAIKDSLVLPAERARLVARHAQFALDDLTYPAEFADGKVLSRVREFEADIKARRPHGYTKAVDFGRVLDGDESRPETPEEYAKRVNARHMGRDRISNGTG